MDTLEPTERKIPDIIYRAAIGALILFVALLVGISTAHAVELVPSIGITRTSTDNAEGKTFYGFAFRGNLFPMFKHETAIGYHSEEVTDPTGTISLKMNTVPMTESIWFAPIPLVYAGVGVGMYFSSLTYENVPVPDTQERKFGYHIGGGLNFPLAPMIGVDLQSRYVFMDEVPTSLPQGNLDPDFWSTSVGIAIKF